MATQQLEVDLLDILEEYLDDVNDISEKDFRKAAKEAVTELKQTSPKDKGAYAQGWAMKRDGDLDYVVYNKGKPGLTHLLENGHIITNRRGGTQYGRVAARKHIEPARNNAEQKLIKQLEGDL